MHHQMLEWYGAYAQRKNLCIINFNVLVLGYFDVVCPNTLFASSLDFYIYVCVYVSGYNVFKFLRIEVTHSFTVYTVFYYHCHHQDAHRV